MRKAPTSRSAPSFALPLAPSHRWRRNQPPALPFVRGVAAPIGCDLHAVWNVPAAAGHNDQPHPFNCRSLRRAACAGLLNRCLCRNKPQYLLAFQDCTAPFATAIATVLALRAWCSASRRSLIACVRAVSTNSGLRIWQATREMSFGRENRRQRTRRRHDPTAVFGLT